MFILHQAPIEKDQAISGNDKTGRSGYDAVIGFNTIPVGNGISGKTEKKQRAEGEDLSDQRYSQLIEKDRQHKKRQDDIQQVHRIVGDMQFFQNGGRYIGDKLDTDKIKDIQEFLCQPVLGQDTDKEQQRQQGSPDIYVV